MMCMLHFDEDDDGIDAGRVAAEWPRSWPVTWPTAARLHGSREPVAEVHPKDALDGDAIIERHASRTRGLALLILARSAQGSASLAQVNAQGWRIVCPRTHTHTQAHPSGGEKRYPHSLAKRITQLRANESCEKYL